MVRPTWTKKEKPARLLQFICFFNINSSLVRTQHAMQGHSGEVSGSVTRQKKKWELWARFIMGFEGRNRRSRASRLRIDYFE